MPLLRLLVSITACWLLASSIETVGAQSARQAEEVKERMALIRAVSQDWYQKDYAGLERQAQRYSDLTERTQSGFAKLAYFYEFFFALAREQSPYFPKGDHFSKLEFWQDALPDSTTAKMVKSIFLLEQAKHYNEVTNKNRVPVTPWTFDAGMLALAKLELQAIPLERRDPHWYVVWLRIMATSNDPLDEIVIAHDEALQRYPTYEPAHLEAFIHLAKRWSSGSGRLEAFANTVVNRTKSQLGMSMYTRLYEDAFVGMNNDSLILNGLNWPAMKAGYQQITAENPVPWNTNHYAFFACMARDAPALREAFKLMAGQIVREAWHQPVFYEACKARNQAN